MQNIKKALLMLAIALTTSAYCSNAQIVVGIRPERPHVVRVEAPSPRHVWIDEEWEPRGGAYVFVGGHWAEPLESSLQKRFLVTISTSITTTLL